MEKYCKNCGANINNAEQFCPDCGKEIPVGKRTIRYCQNCGERIDANENFCRNCGTQVKTYKKDNTGILDKYKTPIIIIAVIVAIAIVAIGAYSLLSPEGSQEVQVDTISFNIPQNFNLDDKLTVDETDDGVRYVSKFWQDNEDYVQIDVTYSASNNVDAKDVADYMGGEKQNMMGYDGYYSELSDAYCFCFVKDNKLVNIYASSFDLFDEIEVL